MNITKPLKKKAWQKATWRASLGQAEVWEQYLFTTELYPKLASCWSQGFFWIRELVTKSYEKEKKLICHLIQCFTKLSEQENHQILFEGINFRMITILI